MSIEPSCCCTEWIGRVARAHTRRMVAIARGEGLSAADALDAVQEGLFVLLGRSEAEGLRDQPDEAAHLLAALVRNAARNMRRRHFRARPHDELDEGALAADDAPVDERLDRAATTARLASCVAGLGEVHRHVITLRVLEEVSGEAAAAALGLTPGHVAVLLHRARKQLVQCMSA